MQIYIHYYTSGAPADRDDSFLRGLAQYICKHPELGHSLATRLDEPYDLLLISGCHQSSTVCIDLAEIRTIKERPQNAPLICWRPSSWNPLSGGGIVNEMDRLQWEVLRLSDYQIFPHQDYLARVRRFGFQTSNYAVIPNGADQNHFNHLYRKFWDGRRKIKIISCPTSVSSIVECETIALCSLNPEVECLFTGQWNSQVDPRNVKLLPPMRQEELARLYKSADVFLHAAQDDLCPDAILEALSCGFPVIYHNSGAAPDIVAAYGFSLPETLTSVSINEMLHQLTSQYGKLIQKILAERKQFSVERAAAQYLQAFETASHSLEFSSNRAPAPSIHPINRSSSLAWLSALPKKIPSFVERMQMDNYSSFHYSYSGDLLTDYSLWGLANSVYATKILFITKALPHLVLEAQNNIYRKVISFTKEHGSIFDEYLTSDLPPDSAELQNTRRAETRQSFAALYLLNRTPRGPYLTIPYTEEGVIKYLESFDWVRPWSAGSHFSHLLFFYHLNSLFFNYRTEDGRRLIEISLQWLKTLQSPSDGCWYRQHPDLKIRINGAMKILTALHVINHFEFDYPERLIDTALEGSNHQEACDNFNIVYTLYGATRLCPNYRHTEIENFLLDRLAIYRQFYFEELGGFSFLVGKANPTLYGKTITTGKNEPDIHGTIMFTWGISIINQMIDLGLDFQVPLN